MASSKKANHFGSAAALAAACLFFGLSMAAAANDTNAGKKVFTETAAPACAICHTLADAGSQGQIGPNLDELQPSAERVYKAVTDGIGAMPPYADTLSEAEREAVAAYVASVTG
ncbi:MAG TPA: cytochrome c [Salinisphaeraceae bacterium]|nr:cytochrome c [Salinisphaeraceae bacterium]